MPAPAAATHQTGHHEQLVFNGRHCQPTSNSHVLPASFLVRSTHLAEDFLIHLNTQRFPESFPLDDRQTVNPEMNASANRRFLSRSQKRVCESATFELAFSNSRGASRRSISSSCFLCSSFCFPASASSSRTCLTFRLGSCSGSSTFCDGKLLLLLYLTRTFSSRGKTIDLSPVRGEEVAASRPMVWRKS